MCTEAGRAAAGAAIALLLGLVLPVALAAQGSAREGETATVALSWSPVEGAGGYTVELATLEGKPMSSVTVEAPSVTLAAPPGTYLVRIVSLNNFMRPESETPWKKIRIVRKGMPKVERIEPAELEPGVASQLILRGANLDAATAASLRRSGAEDGIAPLSVRPLASGGIELSFGPIGDVGRYSLELFNKPDYRLSLPEAVTVRHEAPVIAELAPARAELSGSALRFEVRAKNIAPGAKLFLERGGARLELAAVGATGAGVMAELATGDAEAGVYDLVVENDELSIARAAAALSLVLPPPPPPPVEEPAPQEEPAPVAEAVAEEEAPEAEAAAMPAHPAPGLKLSLGTLWSTSLPLGDWARLYPMSAESADLFVRARILESSRDAESAALAFGAELRARASNYGALTDDPTYVGSTLASYGLELGPWLSFSRGPAQALQRISCGCAYSRIAVSGARVDGGAQTLGYSVDPYATASLELGYRPAPDIACGLEGGARCVFYSDVFFVSLNSGFYLRFDL